ncbi:MAG: class F sortase [Patescibacteria group bacterium]|jgi:LPXTG-site transpeptidase (sortase) family protein
MPINISSKGTGLIITVVSLAFLAMIFSGLAAQEIIFPAGLFTKDRGKNQIQNDFRQLTNNSLTPVKQKPLGNSVLNPIIRKSNQLIIPSIHVNAIIEKVGLTLNGEMAVPQNLNNVAWYKLGPKPGEIGSAVMAGHFGWKNNRPSTFNNLHKLRARDKVQFKNDKGVIITFVVRESREYDPLSDAFEIFNSNDNKAHLNLITCQGIWDKISKNYSKRLVVFTDKEEK